jgi:hypothetical protein
MSCEHDNFVNRVSPVPAQVAVRAVGHRAAWPAAAPFPGSVQLRHVDAGSGNGCELEIASAFDPVYDAERFGAR